MLQTAKVMCTLGTYNSVMWSGFIIHSGIDNRRDDPWFTLLLQCYHFLRVFELHTMRLFASLQLSGGSGLMKMIVGLGGSYQSITLRRHKFRWLFVGLECFGVNNLRDVDYRLLQHLERYPFGIQFNIFLNWIIYFVHILYQNVNRHIKSSKTIKISKTENTKNSFSRHVFWDR